MPALPVKIEAKMRNNILIPKRIQLEVVFGCNAKCVMCPVDMPTKRKKGVMSMELFRKIIDDLKPFAAQIEKVDLWGLGEPLLDKTLFEKIRYAKREGFQSIAIATNGDLMNEKHQDALLSSGIDTIIFSIDGYRKSTHENIRKGVNFDSIVANAESIIRKRDAGNYKTRFVFRFIRQESNKAEWDDFRAYWKARISSEKKDLIIGYGAHTWGGELGDPQDRIAARDQAIDAKPCHHVYDRLMILWDGTVPLCCSDLHHANYSLGNVRDASPIEIFNNEKITAIRAINEKGKKTSMKICSDCTILYSEAAQDVYA
ncbi:MAG: SPASM domain-containing protein [Candidatus Omnitrophica bacterium]|nr:SPASM domain-containing protein [Candidatus Omnitrophota bacterium]